MEKTCKTCLLTKQIDNFAKNSECKDGYVNHCKECFNKKQKEKWHANKSEVAKKRSERRKNKIQYYRESERRQRKNYRERNKEKVNKKYREYIKEYKIKNPAFKIQKLIATTIKRAMEKRTSSFSIFVKLGYTIQDLMSHLESQFKEGMSWKNYGEWHIDHIVPQSWLPFTSIEEENFIKCWQLSNLQPLWAKDNISKGNRYSGSPENPTAFLYDLDFLRIQQQSDKKTKE